jgi:hypothetical protein
MPVLDASVPDAEALPAFLALCGPARWEARLAEIGQMAQSGAWRGRAAQQRHAVEFALARLGDPRARARAGVAERRVLALVEEAVRLAGSLPAPRRARLEELVAAGLEGEATLVSIFHLLRTAAPHRARGFEVAFDGLAEDAPYDLLIRRDGAAAEIACETVSAEEGRPVHRGDWFTLVDAVHPELQTWLAAHPGRYLLKMTLPEGITGEAQLAGLHRRILALLQDAKRQDASADAVLKLDPLVLAGAQAAAEGLPARLRAQFGPEAHLAVTTGPGGGSVFVMAARAGRENAIAGAVTRRMALAAQSRLSGVRPGILAMFVEDVDRTEWRTLREKLELEGAARRFLTEPAARPVVAVSCASRMEMFGLPAPDAAPDGEMRFRNPSHPQAKLAALAAAVSSSV